MVPCSLPKPHKSAPYPGVVRVSRVEGLAEVVQLDVVKGAGALVLGPPLGGFLPRREAREDDLQGAQSGAMAWMY